MPADIMSQQIHPISQEAVRSATGYKSIFAPGTPVWLAQQMKRQEGDFDELESLSRQMGGLKLNLPEFDVQRGDQYTKMFQSVGRREGDLAARSVSEALAGRGGGGLGSSVALQSQARSAPNLQALSEGVGYDFRQYQADLQNYMARMGAEQARYGAEMGALQAQRQGLQNALAQRFNVLNQIVGAQIGQLGAGAQIEAARQAGEAHVEAAIWGAMGSMLGG